MKITYNLVLVLLIILPYAVCGQGKGKMIELMNANSLEYDERTGGKIKKLIGDVAFKHEQVILRCDSAFLYPDNNLNAFGRIHITQGDSLHIYGDILRYNGNSSQAEIQKNTRLVQRDMTLTTDILYYDMSTGSGHYNTPGRIVNKDNVLTSKKGYYNSRASEFTFQKDVVLVNPQYVMRSDTLKYNSRTKTAFFYGPTTITSEQNFIFCKNGWYNTAKDICQFNKDAYLRSKNQVLKGDSIYYDRKIGYGKAIKNIQLVDSIEKMNITGDMAEYFNNGENSLVTGKARLLQIYDKDTLHLHGDTLRSITERALEIKRTKKKSRIAELQKDTTASPRLMLAYNRVKFYKSDMQGKCDSLAYTYKDSTMRLFGAPVLWSDRNQLTGEKVEIVTAKGRIRHLDLTNNAFIVSSEDTNKYNQIKGKTMRGLFQDNKLSKINVKGNGQTIYYGKDKEKFLGVNKAECSDLSITVENNEVKKITFFKKPAATFYPLNELPPSELILKDFKWRGPERPLTPEQIFIW